MFASLRDIRIPSVPSVWLPGRSTPVRKPLHVFHAHSYQTDRDGNVIWVEDGWAHNILHDEGEQFILARSFDTDNSILTGWTADMYIGLDARPTLAETDTLTTVSAYEPSSSGSYARQVVSTSTGFTIAASAPYYNATSADVSFTASGASFSTAVDNRFLATTVSGTSGKLIAALELSDTRTINDGDTLTTRLVIGLS